MVTRFMGQLLFQMRNLDLLVLNNFFNFRKSDNLKALFFLYMLIHTVCTYVGLI